MSSVVIAGDTSGSITLQAPAVAGTTTHSLPATSGTVALTSDVIGVEQTWQNLTASRALGTTYTNTTGKPILVQINQLYPSTTTSTLTVGGVIASRNVGASNYELMLSAIVPPGNTYVVTNVGTLKFWYELR